VPHRRRLETSTALLQWPTNSPSNISSITPTNHTLYINTYLHHTSPKCFGVSHTNFSENFAFLIQNHLLLQSYCLRYSGCITKYKTYNFVGLQYFDNG